MKAMWLATAAIFFSINTFAACPAGTQGSSKVGEAAAIMKRVLNADLRVGSSLYEKTSDGKPLKIKFGSSGGQLTVAVYRSTEGPSHLYNLLALPASVAEVCGGGGTVTASAAGYSFVINKVGGGYSVGTSAGTYKFGALTGGTEIANVDN